MLARLQIATLTELSGMQRGTHATWRRVYLEEILDEDTACLALVKVPDHRER